MRLRFIIIALAGLTGLAGCGNRDKLQPAATANATSEAGTAQAPFSGSEVARPTSADTLPIAEQNAAGPPQLAPVATSLRQQPIFLHALKTVAFHSQGELLATGDGHGRVHLWNVPEGRLIRTLTAHTEWAFAVAFSPDGRLLASGGGDNRVKIWDLASGELKHELIGHTDDVHGVVFFDDDGARVASGADDMTARIWDLATGESTLLKGHTAQVTAVAASPDGKLIATASRDASVRLWDADSGEFVRSLEKADTHQADVLDLAFNYDGSRLATASYDKSARLWEVKSGWLLQSFNGHDDWVFAVAISPDGKQLATGAGDKKLRLWNIDGDEPQHVVHVGQDISALDYHPDGQSLAASLADGAVQLFDLRVEKAEASQRLGPAPAPPKENSGSSSKITPQEYLDLHMRLLQPGADSWKQAVTQLAQVGDGFSLKQAQDIDQSKLSPEDRTLLANTSTAISHRVATLDAAQVAVEIQTRFERAATADLQCHPLEGVLAAWVSASIEPFADRPAVRQELERIRDQYQSDLKLGFGTLQGRVRHYAQRLLKNESVEATR